MRTGKKERTTSETNICAQINLDGQGKFKIDTGLKFFDHMLSQLAMHSGFDIIIKAESLDSDPHHLVEDTAIALGAAFFEALGGKKGIKRYAHSIVPMDEALIMCAVDISGRPFSKFDAQICQETVSGMETLLFSHFFSSFSQHANITIHLRQLDGKDAHHIIEGAFKALAKSLKESVCITGSEIPSTKGIL